MSVEVVGKNVTVSSPGHWLRVVCILVLVGTLLPSPAAARSNQSDTPNILVVLVDDLDTELFNDHLGQWDGLSELSQVGTSFSQAYVSTPLCGPSRASMLSGQLATNTGIQTNGNRWESGVPGRWLSNNQVPSGGFGEYLSEGLHTGDLGASMQALGYQTGLVGKYLHTGFPDPTMPDGWTPPGWDEFHASLGDYWNFQQLSNGNLVKRSGFRTDVEADQAVSAIRNFENGSTDPWMLYLAPFGPHTSPGGLKSYPPRYQHRYRNEPLPEIPDAELRPPLADDLRTIPDGWRTSMQRNRLRSMLSVDDMVSDVLAEVDLSETVVVFTSDNGMHLGGRGFRGRTRRMLARPGCRWWWPVRASVQEPSMIRCRSSTCCRP